MNFIKLACIMKRSAVLLIAVAVTTAASMAQGYHLPTSHNIAHNYLLANQTPVSNMLKLERSQKFIEDINKREAMNDNEIFSMCWDSQAVNPYGNNVAIPQRKNINVADYHIPVPGPVTSNFGWRPRFGRMHKGVDLRLSVGDTVRAAFSGKVRLTKYNAGGYGYYVVIRHDNGMETLYGHLSRFIVKPNQRVKAGDPIALGGNTGRSTGPHLHFETRYLGIAINPAAIFDFENKTTHKDVFAFDRATCERAQNYAPSRRNALSAKNKTAVKHKGKKRSRRR